MDMPRTVPKTMPKVLPPTLCWDCENAVGWCSWSKDLKPVDGWTAEYVPDKDSYYVEACPQFQRDAYGGGAKRVIGRSKTRKSKQEGK